MQSIFRCLALIFFCAATLAGHWTSAFAQVPRGTNEQFYLKEIKPLLRSKCVSCHGPLKQEAGLRLDAGKFIRTGGDSGQVIDLDDVDDSYLLERISTDDVSDRMPPDTTPLTADQIQRIRNWVRGGAKSPPSETIQATPREHWAFQPIDASIRPPQHEKNPIDAFVRQRLKSKSLTASKPTTPALLVRRMYFGLHGLPPTPELASRWTNRIERSTENTSTTSRFDSVGVSELIDELLESPRYGERWAQHWLDIVRYADTDGFEVNTPRAHAWRYRDYVIRSFNEDKPYNSFVFEQLAGDSVRQDAATGFLVAAPVLLPGQIGKDEASKRLARQDALDEMVVGTSSTFLGLTIGCARCHDHKFDPISQRDYYAMQAYFAGVEYGDRPIFDPQKKQKQMEAETLKSRINKLTDRLAQFEPRAQIQRILRIDDRDPEQVELLHKSHTDEAYSVGTQRGFKDDPGSPLQSANLGRGSYKQWEISSAENVIAWKPNSKGRFRIWVSWGIRIPNEPTHDARYLIDLDGDLETLDDQSEIAKVDQRRFADQQPGPEENVAVWSGWLNCGEFILPASAKLVLRSGTTGRRTTADIVLFEEVKKSGESRREKPHEPHLRAPVNAAQNVDRFQPVKAKMVRFVVTKTNENNRYEPCLDELEIYPSASDESNQASNTTSNIAPTAIKLTSSGNYSESGIHQIKHINDGKVGNQRSWISNQKGKGWIQLEFAEVTEIERVHWGRDRTGKFKDRLATEYRIEVSTDGKSWNQVAGSTDRVDLGVPFDRSASLVRRANDDPALGRNAKSGQQIVASFAKIPSTITKLSDRKAELDRPQMAYAGKFRKPDVTHFLNRGDPEQRGETIAPKVPKFIGSLARAKLGEVKTEQQRRIQLANWITDPRHPLTARVIVNRIWQYHFGRGLVDNASDFGLAGTLPSHPQLLDWLASEFIRNGWSIKKLHRLILTSKTYQQSSRIREKSMQVDGDNRLLWRFSSQRIQAESIRDSILQISGNLNLEMGGPGFDFFKSRGGLSGFPPVKQFEARHLRRMVYAHKIRMESVPVFGAFDCPDAGQPAAKRSQSTTVIQALNLFNSEFMIAQSRVFAERVQKSEPDSVEEQVRLAFQMALGRNPTQPELADSVETVRDHELSVLCRVLFNSNEFLFVQ